MKRKEVQFGEKRRAGKRLVRARAGEDVWRHRHEAATNICDGHNAEAVSPSQLCRSINTPPSPLRKVCPGRRGVSGAVY